MWCEQLGARRRDTHSSCDTASLAHTLCKKWTTLHTQTHTLACIKGNTVDVGVKLYQPSLLSMHVKLYSAISCSIVAPPSSPLRNMVEIAEDSSTFWLCLRLIPGVSGCCQYFVLVYSDPRWPNDMLAKYFLNMLAVVPWAHGLALQKSTTLAVSFTWSALDSAAGKVFTSLSISAGLRCRICKSTTVKWLD